MGEPKPDSFFRSRRGEYVVVSSHVTVAGHTFTRAEAETIMALSARPWLIKADWLADEFNIGPDAAKERLGALRRRLGLERSVEILRWIEEEWHELDHALGLPRPIGGLRPQLRSTNIAHIDLITTTEELHERLLHTVDEASACLAVCGSRSRDEKYLASIVRALKEKEHLTHYRVLMGDIWHPMLKDHLLTILKTRDPNTRPHGTKETFLGMFTRFDLEPERFVCANENRAIVILPSLTGVQKYDTALEFQDREHASAYVRLVQEMYWKSEPIETHERVAELKVIND